MFPPTRSPLVSRLPFAIFGAVVAMSVLAGLILALEHRYVAYIVLKQLLQPGGNTAYLLAEDRLMAFYFPVKLSLAGTLFFATPLTVAWLVAINCRQFMRLASLMLLSSVLVSGAVLYAYREYMQVEVTNLQVAGRPQSPRLRGSLTPVSSVPLGKLALSGPFLVSTFVLVRRRRTTAPMSS
jgi:hypothetical protein